LNEEHRRQVEELFRRYGRGVGSYVRARVGDAHVAETITSSVFLTVVRRIEQCRSSPEGWLWSIVRTEISRYYRDRRQTEVIDLAAADPAPSPVQSAELGEMQARMRQALELLTEQQHRIIYLKFFQDMSNVEIAAAMALSPSNVGVIVHRAVARLRALMESRTNSNEAPTDRMS
jgi:RNA polymerase sigma-70 factor, ECF subfamily